jgi:predicted alpha/beta superfamily hydrolase
MGLPAFAQQFVLTVVVDTIPAKHQQDELFIAGNFNDWKPGAAAWQFKKNGPKQSIQIPLQQKGLYEFKITRGSWDKVMSRDNGADAENIGVNVSSDTTIHIKIFGWKDDFAAVEKKHTHSKNVSIIEQAIIMPQLGRSRRIWIYLPENYKKSTRRYPVLYMHDGQNLFDEYTSGFGEWGIDECLDSLMKQPSYECIVVGIDNGPQRITEYNPYDHDKYGKAEGKQYILFIEQTLKPYIDKNYRTHKDANSTMIAGSSLGGLISYYAALFHPNTFGKAGVFSPSFWIAPEIQSATDSLSSNVKGKLFFYMGGQEGDEHIKNMYELMQRLGIGSSALVYSVVDADGKHNESSWRKWFPEFFRFMMADWTNYIIRD